MRKFDFYFQERFHSIEDRRVRFSYWFWGSDGGSKFWWGRSRSTCGSPSKKTSKSIQTTHRIRLGKTLTVRLRLHWKYFLITIKLFFRLMHVFYIRFLRDVWPVRSSRLTDIKCANSRPSGIKRSAVTRVPTLSLKTPFYKLSIWWHYISGEWKLGKIKA